MIFRTDIMVEEVTVVLLQDMVCRQRGKLLLWGTLTATPPPIKLRYKMHTSEVHAMHRSELHCLIHLYIHACTCVTTTPTVIQNMIQNCALSGSTFSHQRGHFDFFYYLWVCQLLLLLFLKQKNNLFQKRAEVKSPWNTLRRNPGGTDLPAKHVLLLAAHCPATALKPLTDAHVGSRQEQPSDPQVSQSRILNTVMYFS